MLGIIILCILLAFFGIRTPLPSYPASDFGIALSSPNLWPVPSPWSEAANAALLMICGLCVFFLNKRYSLIRTGQPLGASFFLPLTFSNLIIGGHLTSAPVVLIITLIILAGLFGAYRARNATRQIFLTATCLSAGSLFEYAFIPLAAATFLSAFVMEAMRPKEFLAFGLGLIAPYWVAIGTGLINPLNLHMPRPHIIFSGEVSPILGLTLISVGIFAVTALILSLYNGMILYAGNTRVRRSILVINIFGAISLAAMLLDVENIPAYIGVFNVWVSIQFANLFTLREIRRAGLLFWLIQIAIAAFALIFFI